MESSYHDPERVPETPCNEANPKSKGITMMY